MPTTLNSTDPEAVAGADGRRGIFAMTAVRHSSIENFKRRESGGRLSLGDS